MPAEQWSRNLLRRWTRFVVRYAALVVLVFVVATGLLAAYTARNLGVSTDTADMISPELPWRQDYIKYRDQFPLRSNTIIVVVTARTSALAEQAVSHLDGLLDGDRQHFEDSYSPTSDPPLAGRELLYLDLDRLYELVDSLAAMQPFLGRLREHYDLASLLELVAMAAERDRLAGADEFIEAIDQIIDRGMDGGEAVLDWSSLEPGIVIGDPARRLIVVNPVLDKAQARPARAAIEALRQAGQQTELTFGDQLSINLTGVVAVADDEFLSVTRNAGRIGLLALLGVVLLLVIAVRSVRLLIASVATLIAGLVGTAAFAAASVGSLNVISIAFAVLYIGLGVDFVIHFLLRIRELSAQGVVLATALEDASADVGGSLVICATTTAAGFFSFIPTSFTGVSQLGLISGTGMFICLAVTLTLLPALIKLLFRERLPVASGAAQWAPGLWLSGVIARFRTVLLVPLLLAMAGMAVLPQLRFESDPMLLLDPGTESVRTFNELSRNPDTSPRSVSIVVENAADTKALQEKLLVLPTVERTVSLGSFEIVDQDDKRAALDDLALLLGPAFSQYPPLAAVDVAQTRTALARLTSNIEIDGTQTVAALSRLADTLRRLEAQLDAAPVPAELLNRLQYQLLADLPRAMARLSGRLQPSASDRPSYPEHFAERWRSPGGSEVLDVIPALDVTSRENAARFVADVRGVAKHATGLPVVYEESGKTVVGAFQQAFLSAFVAVTVLLLFFLRSVVDTVLVLVPIGLAIAITAVFMVSIDLPLNFANVIALPLLLGIGVDNGIHIVHRTRKLGGDAFRVLATSTSRAMLFSGITTLASFGSLAMSTHQGMAAMGKLLTAGLSAILIVMMIVLPALLAFRERAFAPTAKPAE